MDDSSSMLDLLQDALDDLVSPRSSLSRKGRALVTLERLVASIYVPTRTTELHAFLCLQDLFQCNIPSRLLVWISTTASRLDTLTSVPEYAISKQKPEDATETATLASHLIQALNIIQGVVLSHAGSKRFLARRYALEILVHLFLVSRRVPTKSTTPRSVSTPSVTSSVNSSASSEGKKDTPALAAVILDALSCILVDAPPAMRAFEEAGGVRSVVRVLKRPGTGREIKIKCMEFLYFYVNAENPSWMEYSSSDATSEEGGEIHHTKYATSHRVALEARDVNLPLDLVLTIPNSPTSLHFSSPDATSTPPNLKVDSPTVTPPTRRASHQSTQSFSQPADATSPIRTILLSPANGHVPAAVNTHRLLKIPARQNAPQIQRKESASLRASSSNIPMSGPETPKKGQQVLREYPKTPRKALQPLNLQSGARRPSQIHGLAPAASVPEGGGHRRTPSTTSPNGTRAAGLGQKRSQTQLSTSVSPRSGSKSAGGARPASALSGEVTSETKKNRPGHKRSQSSLELRCSQSLANSQSSPPPAYGGTRTPTATTFPAIAETPLHPAVPETPVRQPFNTSIGKHVSVQTRTKEEKTEILRGMMNNVDALLEGMSRVGIWGLA